MLRNPGIKGFEPLSKKHAKEMTKDEFASALKKDPIVILPIGAMEEHGSHLPLGTDTYEVEHVVDRLADQLDAVVLPTIPYGECRSTYNFPGTISLSFDSLRSVVTDIIAEVQRHKGRRLLIISGHAGGNHMVALKMAAQEAVRENGHLKIMVLSDYDIVPDFKEKKIPEWDGHAGMAETSRMLSIRPDISRKSGKVTKPKNPEYMILPDPERLFPSGIMGDPSKASPELGSRIDDFILKRLLSMIRKNLG